MNAKKLAKKFAAISMVAAMVVTAPTFSFAADPITSVGESEGGVSQKKVVVTLPSITDDDVKYHVDPQRLINATSDSASGLGYSKIDDDMITPNAAGVYFGANVSSPESAEFDFLNVGTEDVVITVKAEKVADSGTMALTVSKNAAELPKTESPAALYMAISGARSGEAATPTVAPITDQAAELSMTVSGSPANYVVTKGASGFDFVIKSGLTTSKTDATAAWDCGSFKMEGYCQEGSPFEADGKTELTAPSFKITWSLDPENDSEAEEPDEPTEPTEYEGYAKVQLLGSNNYYLVTPSSNTVFEGVTNDNFAEKVTKFDMKYNNGEYVSVLSSAKVSSNSEIGLKWVDVMPLLGVETTASGDKITAKVVVEGKTYVAVYTKP